MFDGPAAARPGCGRDIQIGRQFAGDGSAMPGMAAVRHPGSIAQTGLARNGLSLRQNTRGGMSCPPSEKRTPPFVFQPKALGGLSAGPLAGGQGRSRAAVARHAPALRACQRSGRLNAKHPWMGRRISGFWRSDGSFSGGLLPVCCKSDVLVKLRAALKTQQIQPHAPQPTAVLLSGHRLLSPVSPLPAVSVSASAVEPRGDHCQEKSGKTEPPIDASSANSLAATAHLLLNGLEILALAPPR